MWTLIDITQSKKESENKKINEMNLKLMYWNKIFINTVCCRTFEYTVILKILLFKQSQSKLKK